MSLHIVPTRRILSWSLWVLLLAGFMVSLTPQRVKAAPPSVTFVGADITTNDAWRTTSVAKPLDIDGDNIYGSDGFYLFSGGTHTLTAPPPYATVTSRPGMTVYSGNPSYTFYDNPDLTGTGPVPDVITGVIYNTNNPTEWVDITFTQPGLFRVGIITDNADNVAISPLNFRFQQMVGGTVDTGYIPASADRDQDIDYYLFDVEANAGDVYRLSGQNAPGHTSNGIAAIFFDGIPTLTITDTTAGTATNDGTVNVNEYVGFTTGINNGFGNVIGSASRLNIDSDGSGNLNLGLEAGTVILGTDAMVVYIDTDNGLTGFATTGGFTDIADGCRRAISGFDGTNRSTLNFAPGFTANYAICLDSISGGFAGLWELTNGGSHTFITSLNRTNTGTDYEMNFSLANLGLSAGSQFRYVATYLNGSNAFRSNEFHGVAIFAGGNPGYATVNLTANSFITFEAVDTTLVVDRVDDTNAAAAQVCDDALPNDCSLRGAISKANTDTTGAYTISFAPNLNGIPLTLSLAGTGEDGNTTGDLDITDDLTITGNGATSTIIQAGTNSTNGLDRVFHIGSGSNVTFNDVTIRYGRNTSASGGGIFNFAGTVTVNQSTISSNTATFGGGMMNEQGTTTLNQSTVSGNVATGNGGGIDSDAFGLSATLNVYNSTFSGNSAGYAGGGILAYTGGVGNTTVNLINATIHNNSGTVGGLTGWDNGGGVVTFNLQNSIVADQAGALTDCAIINGGSFVSNNYNLDSDGTCNLVQANDIPAGTANLGPLQDNGGPTLTHALLSGSQAIDAGNNGACAAAPINNVDQRGITRPQNLTCDIGAYELVTAVTPSANGGDGPGGVGTTNGSSNLVMWLRADQGTFTNTGCTIATSNGNSVGCWQDRSGSGNQVTQATATNQPTFNTNMMNGNPVLVLDGNDFLATVTASIIGNNNNYTKVSVSRLTASGSSYNLISAASGGNHAHFYLNTQPSLFHSAPFLTSGIGQLNNDIIFASIYNPTTPRAEILVNGSSHGISNSPPAFTDSGSTQIGRYNTGSYFIGYIPEAIVFNANLTAVERILVDNYLGAKYNIALNTVGGALDVYDGDTVGNGNFDLDVAGIGQLGGNQHTQAHGAGMIVVNGTFLNENGDWLLFGHNTVNNGNTTDQIPTDGDWDGTNDVRWARHWTIDVTDPSVNNGTVDIIFDFSEAGMNGGLPPNGPVSNYRLLRRAGASGQFSDITTLSGATVVIAGDQVQFLGVDVAQLGSNFTLGSVDGAAAPTAITTQNVASQISQPPYLILLVLLLILLAGTIAAVWRQIV